MNDKTFKRLERLNIDIDLRIDEERYKEVYQVLKPRASLHLPDCFPPNSQSTHNADDKWSKLLDRAEILPLPIEEAGGIPLKMDSDSSVRYWSYLLYAKLIRAHIQEMGADCYLRRLDDVIAFLERSLPPVDPKDASLTKLFIFYLFELSAASKGYEILSFARRALQILIHRRNSIGEEFYWFYDLLAHYNCGVAYFHESRYRQAVREFNYVIKEVRKVKESKNPENIQKKTLFENQKGDLFLFLPSVLYRADVQIKLQLEYHALDTLKRYLPANQSSINSYSHKFVRAELIRANANQEMYDIAKSWDYLDQAFKYVSELEGLSEELGEKRNFAKLPDRFRNKAFQNVKGRFVDIFIEDHLIWLEYFENTYSNALSCVNMLQSVFHDIYFRSAKYHAHNRNGYYQQLAKLLVWLTKKYKKEDNKFYEAIDGKPVTQFCELAEKIYLSNRYRLIQSERDKREVECPDCEWQGIDLGRLGPEHYKWFTEAMLDFYENMKEYYTSVKSLINLGKPSARQTLAIDKRNLILRLLEIEREYREDLRVTDLELRYKSDLVTDKLGFGSNGRDLCLRGSLQNPSNFNEAFSNLLACMPLGQHKEGLIDSRQYWQIIKRWWDHYIDHLKYRSAHQRHINGLYFISLRRWNSSSPAQGRSVGGGYLLYKTDNNGTVDLAVAIDPGFDFLRNLFHMGFSLDDIDIILISHAHADHIRDFESIAIMLNELKKRDGKRKKIHVILTLGAYKRLEHIIEDPTFRFFIEPYIIDEHKEIDPDYFEKLTDYGFSFERESSDTVALSQFARYRPMIDPNGDTINYPMISICPTRAYHDDASACSDSFGFILKVSIQVNSTDVNNITLGYTGDTKWVYPQILDPLGSQREITEISTQYRECETVVTHLGTLIHNNSESLNPFDLYNQCNNPKGSDKCEVLVRKENHPYLVGMLRLLSSLYRNRKRNDQTRQLILVGEFGEELRGGIRSDLIWRFEKAYGERLSFLPLDVGMDIQLWPRLDPKDTRNPTKQKVWCVQCEEFVRIEEADFERYGVDEALFCVCETCQKATPINVLQDRLRQLYELGHELRTHENR